MEHYEYFAHVQLSRSHSLAIEASNNSNSLLSYNSPEYSSHHHVSMDHFHNSNINDFFSSVLEGFAQRDNLVQLGVKSFACVGKQLEYLHFSVRLYALITRWEMVFCQQKQPFPRSAQLSSWCCCATPTSMFLVLSLIKQFLCSFHSLCSLFL